jgi:hypothetical protein
MFSLVITANAEAIAKASTASIPSNISPLEWIRLRKENELKKEGK